MNYYREIKQELKNNEYERLPQETKDKLINKEENALLDLRNVYMAMHHIIKYRGNFLRDGSFNISEFDSKLLDTLNGNTAYCPTFQIVLNEVSDFYVDGNSIEFCFQYLDQFFDEKFYSFANTVYTPDEGTHVRGFRIGFNKAINEYAEESNYIKKGQKIDHDCIRE